jgi:CheY-like chemotaxis protein
MINTIITAGERAAGLARQLLTFSRQSRSISTPVDLHQVINDAVELVSRSIDRRITITTTLSAQRSFVMGDPSQLQNAILNLCLNARDAMPNGGRLDLKTEMIPLERGFAAHLGFDLEAGNYLRLAVIDTGVGMTPDIIARIFEPFFTTKEVGRGTGLGLSVVWGTIKEHHGAILVSSQPGAGTTFDLYFPLVDRDASDRPSPETPIARGRGRILVIDDEELVRSATTLLLEDLGYQVVSVADGQSGVDLFTAEHDRLTAVLLDVVMPRMGGRDAFLAMHTIDPAVPIIMSSGFTRDVAVRDLREQGLFAFIAKPFRKQELAELMARAATSRTTPT